MRRWNCIRYSLSLIVTLLIAAGAMAQVTTGRMIGTVTDDDGGTLPGASVTVNSDALLGGARTGITDGNGDYTFVGLPVGLYTVQVALDG